jgi:hypothetical protein
MARDEQAPDRQPDTRPAIGRVNLSARPDEIDPEDMRAGWNLTAIGLGVIALVIMVIALLIILQWALEPLPA